MSERQPKPQEPSRPEAKPPTPKRSRIDMISAELGRLEVRQSELDTSSDEYSKIDARINQLIAERNDIPPEMIPDDGQSSEHQPVSEADAIQAEIDKWSAEQAGLDPVNDSERIADIDKLINMLMIKRNRIEPELIRGSATTGDGAPKVPTKSSGSIGSIQARIGQLQKKQANLDPTRNREEYERLDIAINNLIVRRNSIKPSLVPDGQGPRSIDTKGAGTPELSGELHRKLAKARQDFIDAKVVVESHFAKRWFGGKARAERLDSTKQLLSELEFEAASIMITPSLAKLEAEAAKRGDNPSSIKEAAAEIMAVQVFSQFKGVDQGAAEKYDQILEQRSGFRKLAAKAGRWFTRGGKIAKWVKGGGAGFAAGATTAALATWPITMAVGAASGLGIGVVAKEAALEARAGEKRMTDEQAEAWINMLKDAKLQTGESNLSSMIIDALDRSAKDSLKRQDELRKTVRGAMGRYALGFAAGGIATNSFGKMLGATPDSGAKMAATVSGSGAAPAVPVEVVVPTEVADFSGYRYPWNWAADQFGAGDAMGKLKELGKIAAEHGHNVEWHGLGDGNPYNDWVSVNGVDNTQEVLEVLSQYAK